MATLLQEHGTQPQEIGAIILSHHHWDHTGDLTLFPASTKLIVGTGYSAKYLPGWPKDPEAVVTTSDTYEGREIVELEFSLADPKIGKIASHSAYDWFGDGSLYILGTPGHTTSHLSCLARTTTDDDVSTFMFFGGDMAHHCSLLRPSKYCPLPEMISPAPYDKAISDSSRSTERYTSIHRARDHSDGEDKSRVTPFCIVPEGFLDEDTAETQATIDKSLVLDGDENVFTVLAHDSTLLDVVDFFPKLANDWKAKRWGQQSHWRFLGSLHGEPA